MRTNDYSSFLGATYWQSRAIIGGTPAIQRANKCYSAVDLNGFAVPCVMDDYGTLQSYRPHQGPAMLYTIRKRAEHF